MDIDFQDVLIFVHVLLFGYWLGADLGVFYCDSQLTRDDLSLEERLRVREIRRKVDMAPRTCVALILPIGFMLSVQYGSPITGWWLVLASGIAGNLFNAWGHGGEHSAIGASTAVFGAVGVLGGMNLLRYRSGLLSRWPMPIAAAMTQNTSVSAIALKMLSNENTRFMSTIQKIMLATERGFLSDWSRSSTCIMCHISFVAVYIMKTPPKRTMIEWKLNSPSM